MHPAQTITDDNFDGQLRSAVEALIAKASDIVVGKAELEVKKCMLLDRNGLIVRKGDPIARNSKINSKQ